MAPSTWQDCISARLKTDCGANTARAVLDTLSAFADAQGDVPESPVWSELCAWAVEVLAELESTLVIRLSAEVDPHQAAMFGRRFFALESFLKERADVHPEAQAYLIGLAIRSTGILAKGARIATRIRALVDYLFSYGALLDYQQTKNPSSIEELAHSARFSAAGAGRPIRGRPTGAADPGNEPHISQTYFQSRKVSLRALLVSACVDEHHPRFLVRTCALLLSTLVSAPQISQFRCVLKYQILMFLYFHIYF